MKWTKALVMNAFVLGAAFSMAGCKPEIAETLEDYCAYHKKCDYVTVNTETQFHDLKTCDRFHKDLLDSSSSGDVKGCSGYVEDFFIEFMEAQMDYGCDATLEQSLNSSEDTQEEMRGMMECIQKNTGDSEGSESSNSAQDVGLHVLEELEINLGQLNMEVCSILVSVLGFGVSEDGTDRTETICKMAAALDAESCLAILPLAISDTAMAERICNLYNYP